MRCGLLDEQLGYEIGFDWKYNYKERRGLQERGEAARVKMRLTNAILWEAAAPTHRAPEIHRWLDAQSPKLFQPQVIVKRTVALEL